MTIFCLKFSVVDNWNRISHPMVKDSFGVWSITVPPKDGKCAIPHDSKLKVQLELKSSNDNGDLLLIDARKFIFYFTLIPIRSL